MKRKPKILLFTFFAIGCLVLFTWPSLIIFLNTRRDIQGGKFNFLFSSVGNATSSGTFFLYESNLALKVDQRYRIIIISRCKLDGVYAVDVVSSKGMHYFESGSQNEWNAKNPTRLHFDFNPALDFNSDQNINKYLFEIPNGGSLTIRVYSNKILDPSCFNISARPANVSS